MTNRVAQRHFPTRLLAGLLLALPLQAFSQASCPLSMFSAAALTAPVQTAKTRFDTQAQTFVADTKVDSIFEVDLAGKTVDEIDRQISGGVAGYFTPTQQTQVQTDGFSMDYRSTDNAWKKTVKVTTHNPRGLMIVPYVQVFYEDAQGGVVRLKPYGTSDAPATLVHLKQPHGTKYIKLDPAGDLSYDNEAFKVDARNALPKAPTQVEMPAGVTYGTPAGETYLAQCWTFRTHVPLKAQ
jgi:hypothetical protein